MLPTHLGAGRLFEKVHQLLAELRAATRPHHVALEDALPLMRPGITRASYETVLLRFLGIYAPLESAVAHHGEALSLLGIDVRERRKRHLLEQDLVWLGHTPGDVDLAEHAEAPKLESVAAALGALYVMEGATLGGQLISRHLKTTLGLDAAGGGAFFAAYGKRAGPMWKQFIQAVEGSDVSHHPEAVQDATDAAVATFRIFLDFAVPKGVRP